MQMKAIYTNDAIKYKVDGQIITSGDALGVKGIDVPISGSLSGMGVGGGMSQYVLAENGIRSDIIRRQVTTSDLTEQIKELGALSPAFAVGKPQAKLQRERLDQGKRNMMSMLAESYHDVHIGSRTFNELGHSPMSNQFIISHDRLREDS